MLFYPWGKLLMICVNNIAWAYHSVSLFYFADSGELAPESVQNLKIW